MPISSSLTARLGPAPAPSPARWSPYARPSEPRGDGGGKACRPPLHFDPATAMLLGSARKAAASRSNCRAEAAASDVAAPIQRRRGEEKPKPKPAERDEEPPVEECRGGGGFTFLRALVGHTEAISGISLPLGSDKLYSGSADGCVRLWDCNSGKVLRTLFGMHHVGKTPVLFCTLHNSNCIRMFDKMGELSSKKK